ncbi:MAG: phosphomannomutase/phosphoglucomutase, partial [Phycisphaerales bacterium]
HFYFRNNFNADSGVISMCVVLSILAKTGKHMSQLVHPLARYPQSGEINFQIEEKDAAIAALRKEYGAAAKGATIDDLDGITIDAFAKHGWWCNVRKSNTEPLLRLNLEAKDKKTLEHMLTKISPMLGHRVAH